MEVAALLGVKVRESFATATEDSPGGIFSWGTLDDVSWARFPVDEMIKRGWFLVERGRSKVQACRDYFVSAAGPEFASAYHRKKLRAGNLPNEFALLAWQARVLSLAQEAWGASSFGPFELDERWLSELRSLTTLEDGPVRARSLLAEHGIALVVERHLPGTYLDGAAMISRSGTPVVGLTLRYDRLDHFWFVLFHELGHVFLHLFAGVRFDFFDNDETTSVDNIEIEADRFALEKLLPQKQWDTCLSRFALTDAAVRSDAARLGVGAAVIAGRIRRENNNYQILNECVGNGAVRSQFWGSE